VAFPPWRVSVDEEAGAAKPIHPPQPDTVATSRFFRIAASVLIIGHVWAMLSRPIEFATQGPFGNSPSATLFRLPVLRYSQFAYLDHGYAFFAPDPGPSHLIGATVRPSGGGDPVELRFPDLDDQWPRLLYHRHFMLAEFLNDVHHPPGEPPEELRQDPDALRSWHGSRRRYETVRDSIIGRLRARYPDAEIAIRRIEHRQPGLPEYYEGKVALNDPRLYQTLHDTIDGLPPRAAGEGVLMTPGEPPQPPASPARLPISANPQSASPLSTAPQSAIPLSTGPIVVPPGIAEPVASEVTP
jgi:hypothetical protein